MFKLKNISKANIIINYTHEGENKEVILPACGDYVETVEFESEYLDLLVENGEIVKVVEEEKKTATKKATAKKAPKAEADEDGNEKDAPQA